MRYWAAIRAAAGVACDRVPAGSLGEVLDTVRGLHAGTPRFAQVLAVCSVLVADQPVGAREHAAVDVPRGSTVDLLPPFAGGCPEHLPPERRSAFVTGWLDSLQRARDRATRELGEG